MLVIDDADGPTSIAGVMGGARSEVSDDDHARADGGRDLGRPQHPPTLAWTLGLQSEASLRFEKQLQPEQAIEAQAVATELMIEVCGARLGPGRSTSAATGRRR